MPPLRRRARATAGAIAVALAFAAAATGAWLAWQQRGVVERAGRLHDAYATPFLRVAPAGDAAGVAVLIHGWRCGHPMMLSLARMLARNGVACYAIDLPGHAWSDARIVTSCLPRGAPPARCRIDRGAFWLSAADTAIDALVVEERLADRPVALVGHSMGGVAVDQLSRAGGAPIVARVNLEGRTGRLDAGRNHLFVATPPFLRAFGVGGRPRRDNVRYGDLAAGTAYELANFPGRTHLDLVHDEAINRVLLDWLAGAFGRPLGGDARPLLLPAAVVDGLAALALLAALVWALPLVPLAPREAGRARWWPVVLAAAAAGAAGGVQLARWLPDHALAFRRLQHEVLLEPVVIAAAGLPVLIVDALASRRERAPWRRAAVEAAVGLAAFALFYAVVGTLVDRTIHQVRLDVERLPRFAIFAACAFPFAWAARRSGPRRFALRAAWTIALWGLLLAIARPPGAPAHKEALEWIPLAALAELFAAALAWRPGGSIAPALFVAAAFGWFSAAAYPMLV